MVNGEVSGFKIGIHLLLLLVCVLAWVIRRLILERRALWQNNAELASEIAHGRADLKQRTTITLDGLHGISEYISENKDIPVERLILGVLTSMFEFKPFFVDEACRVVEYAKKDEKQMDVELKGIEGKLDGAKSRIKDLEQRREDLRVNIGENQHKQERAQKIVKRFS